MRFKMMALIAATMFTVPALAQTATDASAPKPVKEKKVCRRLEQTGSILGAAPTCHTKSEWAQIDAKNGRNAEGTMDASRRIGGSRGDGSAQF